MTSYGDKIHSSRSLFATRMDLSIVPLHVFMNVIEWVSRTFDCHKNQFITANSNNAPSFNLSPTFFSQLTIVPNSMVGDNAGNVTLVCDGKLLQYPR